MPVALIEERRKRGLCFYCEEKWHNGHKCKSPKVFIYYLFIFFFFMEGLQSQGLEADLNANLEEELVGNNA